MGADIKSIIRVYADLEGKNGGEQVNIPLRDRLMGEAIGSGPLVGNEEMIDNYGMRAWVDWARKGVAIKNSDEHKSSIDLFAEAKPALSDWGKEMQRDEICDAFYALPSESAPAGLGSTPASASTASCSTPRRRRSAIPGSPTMPTAS